MRVLREPCELRTAVDQIHLALVHQPGARLTTGRVLGHRLEVARPRLEGAIDAAAHAVAVLHECCLGEADVVHGAIDLAGDGEGAELDDRRIEHMDRR